MKEIYFDNSATTQIDSRVLDEMLPFLQDNYGNANSIHSVGQRALTAVDEAREQISNYLNCEPQSILFTSGATESNNIVIQGTIKKALQVKEKVHIITSRIEHPSVKKVFEHYKKDEQVEVSFIDVDETGVLNLDQLESKIQDNTVLISIMYANNEVGSVQPIKEIATLVTLAREKRGEKSLPIYFHTDAVQGFNYLDCDVQNLGVDFLSFSGHKIFAPKGIGGLYIRKGISIEPLNYGGSQEYNLRAGTLNVAGIVGLGKAVELVNFEKAKYTKKIKELKDEIMRELKKISDVRFNGDSENQLPNIINVSFKKAEGESILMMLDMEGISISTGSACSSGALEPSHVLTAMGVQPEWSHGSVRISLGKNNNEHEVAVFVKALEKVIQKLRDMAP